MAGLEVVGAAGKEELAGSIGGGDATLRNNARRVAVDEWGLTIEKSRGLERRGEDERQGGARSGWRETQVESLESSDERAGIVDQGAIGKRRSVRSSVGHREKRRASGPRQSGADAPKDRLRQPVF